MMILNFLRLQLEQEYHSLALWYFVSFIIGIIAFFSYNPALNISIVMFVNIITFALMMLAHIRYHQNIILVFFSCCFCMFFFGVTAGYARVCLADSNHIQAPMTAKITGKIVKIKPSLSGYQVTIDNAGHENMPKLDFITDINKNLDRYSSQTSYHRNNNGHDSMKPNPGKLQSVRINITDKFFNPLDIRNGSVIEIEARLFPLSKSVLPGSFDFGFYMKLDGIGATGYALSAPKLLQSEPQGKISNLMQYIRQKVYHRLIQIMGDDNGNFVAAILIGETKAIPTKIASNMRDTGVAHILSVSGLHLSLVAMIFFVSTRVALNCFDYIAFNFNIKNISAIISMLGSYFYLHISGSNIAATRAFIMTFIFILSIILGRSLYPLRSVAVAAFIILLFLPESILHPSFQLSFSAVLCLISGYEIYVKNQHRLGNSKGLFANIKLYVASNIYSSAIASIVTAPYVIFHFYKFATHSIVMNLVAVPIMSFFMMPLALMALILMPLGIDAPILNLLGWFVSIVIKAADTIVKWPYAVLYFGYISPESLLIFTLGFFWLCFWQTTWRYIGFIIIAISIIMMIDIPKPLLIYDHNFKIIGIRNKEDRLEIYSNNPVSKFTQEYWSSWYGQDKIDAHLLPIKNKDHIFTLSDGRTISLNYWQCHEADVMIITSRKLKCEAKGDGSIIKNHDLITKRQITIY